MTLTIHLTSAAIPLGITLGGLLAVLLLSWLESRTSSGWWDIPLFSMAAALAWIAATAAAWLVYAFS